MTLPVPAGVDESTVIVKIIVSRLVELVIDEPFVVAVVGVEVVPLAPVPEPGPPKEVRLSKGGNVEPIKVPAPLVPVNVVLTNGPVPATELAPVPGGPSLVPLEVLALGNTPPLMVVGLTPVPVKPDARGLYGS